ncbi:MAG TPA: hypothetical protein VMY77_17030 [Chitinophagaceae bacterium]|nr:hypothetical protein [Chitinophagaceae bacterium]
MNDNEKQMTEAESLSIISGMINHAKNRFSETGHLYLLWGFVILICCITQFIMIYFFKDQNAYYVWYSTWLVVIYQFYYLFKKSKRERVKTYTDEIIGFVWLTFVTCSFIIVYIVLKNNMLIALNGCILVMYGMPTFLSGIILRFNSLKIGGIICWLLAIGTMFTAYQYQVLLLAAAVVAAWIIPGFILRSKFKKEN